MEQIFSSLGPVLQPSECAAPVRTIRSLAHLPACATTAFALKRSMSNWDMATFCITTCATLKTWVPPKWGIYDLLGGGSTGVGANATPSQGGTVVSVQTGARRGFAGLNRVTQARHLPALPAPGRARRRKQGGTPGGWWVQLRCASRPRCRSICARTCAGAVPPRVFRAFRLPARLSTSNTSASMAG